jgi:hypothetical protein
MKASHTIISIATLLILANISIANVGYEPDTNSAVTERNNHFSITQVSFDGDKSKLEKTPVADINSNTLKNTAPELSEKEFSYLRFDVNDYMNLGESEITELPVSDFDYLRFDVNTYVEQNPVTLDEMPTGEYNYLRFDVKQYIQSDSRIEGNIGELPTAE